VKIQSLMSVNVVTIDIDDPISKAKHIFEESGFHHLLVVRRGVLVGVVSDRDLLKTLSPYVDTAAATNRDLATLNKKAHQIMCRKLISLREHATVVDAVRLFHDNKISCIPVMDEENKPVGIVSWRDIMRVLHSKFEQSST